jgi:hypothetical protein
MDPSDEHDYARELELQEIRARNYLDELERKAAEAQQRTELLRERYAMLRRDGGEAAVQRYHAEMEAAAMREAARERGKIMDRIMQQRTEASLSALQQQAAARPRARAPAGSERSRARRRPPRPRRLRRH